MRAAILSEDHPTRESTLYLGIRELFVGNVHEAIVHLESAWEISKSLGAGLQEAIVRCSIWEWPIFVWRKRKTVVSDILRRVAFFPSRGEACIPGRRVH